MGPRNLFSSCNPGRVILFPPTTLGWWFPHILVCWLRRNLMMTIMVRIVFKNMWHIYFFKDVFIYICLCWVFIAGCGLSLVVVRGGYSSLWCSGFSLWWLLLLQSTGSRCTGFSNCSTGLLTLRHVGSSRTRDWTCVPCIIRWILNYWTTREHWLYSFDHYIILQKVWLLGLPLWYGG